MTDSSYFKGKIEKREAPETPVLIVTPEGGFRYGGYGDVGTGNKLPIEFDFSDAEIEAINDLARRQEISPLGVLRQALRLYQLKVLGEPDLGPMLPPE